MKILILRVSSIGDVIHTLPSIFLLKKLYPESSISWVVQKKAASMIKSQSFLDHVWVLPNRFLHISNWNETIKIIRDIRQIEWDAILDFQGILKTSALLLYLNGKKYGFDFNHSRLSITSFFTKHHTTPKYTNIIQKNLALANNMELRRQAKKINALDLRYENCSPTVEEIKKSFLLDIPIEMREKIDKWIAVNNVSNFIAISPNTTWQSKHWPLEYWEKLSHLTHNDHNVVLLGKSFGEYADLLYKYAEKNNLNIISAPKWDLIETTYLISKACLLIGPDTGFLHIADFLGIPTIGIFGPTLAKRHGPFLSAQNINNSIQIQCPHLYQKSHGVNGSCMRQLKPETLLENVKKIMESK